MSKLVDHQEGVEEKPTKGRRWIVFGVALAVLLGLGVWWSLPGETEPAAEPEPPASEPVDAPVDGGIEIVERNLISEARDGAGILTYGVVLENTSEVVATKVTYEASVTDGNGNVLESHPDTFQLQRKGAVTSMLMPGQRFGFAITGSWTYDPAEASAQEDLRLEIVPEVGEWWPEHNDAYVFGEIEPLNVEAELFPHEDDGAWPPSSAEDTKDEVFFQYRSSLTGPAVEGYAAVLFRNENGEIVGGHPSVQLFDANDPDPNPTPVPGYQSGDGDMTVRLRMAYNSGETTWRSMTYLAERFGGYPDVRVEVYPFSGDLVLCSMYCEDSEAG